jgi:erythromycin esterase-like protein
MTLKAITLSSFLTIALVWNGAAQSASPVADTMDADARTLDWMATHASAIEAVDRRDDVRDLARWDALTANARIIGLGEQTHGSTEFSRLKLRLIEHGVRSQHVTVVGLENAPEPVAAINRYLHGEPADVDSLMGKLSRLWRTEEIKAVVVWLRDYNAEQRRVAGKLVDMVGIDVMNSSPARDSAMAECIAAEIARRPDNERAMFWAHNIHVSYLPNRMGLPLRKLVGTRYVALGFGTAEGTYRAHAPSNPLAVQSDGHVLPVSTPGSVEVNLARLAPRIGGAAQLYDLRAIVADSRGAWLTTPRSFRHVGTNAAPVIQIENVGAMFDLLMFVPTTSTSHSIAGIQ